jgi:hypothetical protein
VNNAAHLFLSHNEEINKFIILLLLLLQPKIVMILIVYNVFTDNEDLYDKLVGRLKAHTCQS